MKTELRIESIPSFASWGSDANFFAEVARQRTEPERVASARAEEQQRMICVSSEWLRRYGEAALHGNTQAVDFIRLHEQEEVVEIVQDFLSKGLSPLNIGDRHTYLEGLYESSNVQISQRGLEPLFIGGALLVNQQMAQGTANYSGKPLEITGGAEAMK